MATNRNHINFLDMADSLAIARCVTDIVRSLQLFKDKSPWIIGVGPKETMGIWFMVCDNIERMQKISEAIGETPTTAHLYAVADHYTNQNPVPIACGSHILGAKIETQLEYIMELALPFVISAGSANAQFKKLKRIEHQGNVVLTFQVQR